MNIVKPENLSGFTPKKLYSLVPIIKKRNLIFVEDLSVGGDAPKDIIRIYRYSDTVRKKTKNWTQYIAKIGHKWYPNESIMEHLIARIGNELGLTMSVSELAIINGQLRFLSKYFLNSKHQELVHGVDIFAGFVSDREFVEEIEQNRLSREFFTFQFTLEAIRFAFPENDEKIVEGFLKMLVFDAIVGNNDRHFYNWGVVRNIKNKQTPYFSPIYDTARGLFWNDSEQKIVEILKQNNQIELYLKKYINNSFPKTGWENEKNLNHIELIGKIKQSDVKFLSIIEVLITEKNENNVLKMIESNFLGLISENRFFLIKECLKIRFKLLRDINSL
jgi:HipA-like C-terminal domain